MQADSVWLNRVRSDYWRSERYPRPASSRCVRYYLAPQSLGLSLAPGSPDSSRRDRVRAVPARHPAADGLVGRAQHAALLYPPELPASAPVRVGELFGIVDGTIRAALSAWSPRRTLPLRTGATDSPSDWSGGSGTGSQRVAG